MLPHVAENPPLTRSELTSLARILPSRALTRGPTEQPNDWSVLFSKNICYNSCVQLIHRLESVRRLYPLHSLRLSTTSARRLRVVEPCVFPLLVEHDVVCIYPVDGNSDFVPNSSTRRSRVWTSSWRCTPFPSCQACVSSSSSC